MFPFNDWNWSALNKDACKDLIFALERHQLPQEFRNDSELQYFPMEIAVVKFASNLENTNRALRASEDTQEVTQQTQQSVSEPFQRNHDELFLNMNHSKLADSSQPIVDRTFDPASMRQMFTQELNLPQAMPSVLSDHLSWSTTPQFATSESWIDEMVLNDSSNNQYLVPSPLNRHRLPIQDFRHLDNAEQIQPPRNFSRLRKTSSSRHLPNMDNEQKSFNPTPPLPPLPVRSRTPSTVVSRPKTPNSTFRERARSFSQQASPDTLRRSKTPIRDYLDFPFDSFINFSPERSSGKTKSIHRQSVIMSDV